jgi:hypothetical protein
MFSQLEFQEAENDSAETDWPIQRFPLMGYRTFVGLVGFFNGNGHRSLQEVVEVSSWMARASELPGSLSVVKRQDQIGQPTIKTTKDN